MDLFETADTQILGVAITLLATVLAAAYFFSSKKPKGLNHIGMHIYVFVSVLISDGHLRISGYSLLRFVIWVHIHHSVYIFLGVRLFISASFFVEICVLFLGVCVFISDGLLISD